MKSEKYLVLSLLILLCWVSPSSSLAADNGDTVTLELRWFFEGQPPVDVKDWFAELPGNSIKQEERTDLYLVVSGREDLGLKLREGRLELKTRRSTALFLMGSVRGNQEIWHGDKWDFSERNGAVVVTAFTAGDLKGPRHTVDKTRKQRKYDASDSGSFTPVDRKKWLDSGCVIEFTQIEIDGETGWTLGFDAIGAEEDVSEILAGCTAQLLAGYPGPFLTEKESFGYPKRVMLK